MFGLTSRKTKAALLAEVAKLTIENATLRAQVGAIVTEQSFWKNTATEFGNQIEFWQKKCRDLLGQVAAESANVDLRRYVDDIREQIKLARPEPSAIAAVIAMSKDSTQGAYTSHQIPRAEPRVIGSSQ